MSSEYEAWNGEKYPWPPPEGWQQRSDGRYWPADNTALDSDLDSNSGLAQEPVPSQTPAPPTASPTTSVSAAAGLPARSGPMAPGMGSGSAGPSNNDPYAGPRTESKKDRSKLSVVLVILALLVGGCIAGAGAIAFFARDEIDDFKDSQIEALSEVSLDQSTCSIEEGKGVVTVLVDNTTDGDSDYTVSIEFTDSAGQTSGGEVRLSEVHPQNRATATVRSDGDLTGTKATCEVTSVFRLGSR